jgi:MFS-type transporter involved in bile tolerance (Atg22 family)
MGSKRNIALWLLYDFANSIVLVTFFLYYTQWIVIERHVADIWINVTFTASAFLLLLTVPITGFLLDKYWRRITGLKYTTFLSSILYLLCVVFVIGDKPITSMVFFTLALYVYLLTFTFYTPLLNDIAPPEKRGRISGLGIMANYLGQIAGLLVALQFANGTISWFGASPRAETLLPATISHGLLFQGTAASKSTD